MTGCLQTRCVLSLGGLWLTLTSVLLDRIGPMTTYLDDLIILTNIMAGRGIYQLHSALTEDRAWQDTGQDKSAGCVLFAGCF